MCGERTSIAPERAQKPSVTFCREHTADRLSNSCTQIDEQPLNAGIPQCTAFVATDDMTLRRVAAMHEFHAPSPPVVLGVKRDGNYDYRSISDIDVKSIVTSDA